MLGVTTLFLRAPVLTSFGELAINICCVSLSCICIGLCVKRQVGENPYLSFKSERRIFVCFLYRNQHKNLHRNCNITSTKTRTKDFIPRKDFYPSLFKRETSMVSPCKWDDSPFFPIPVQIPVPFIKITVQNSVQKANKIPSQKLHSHKIDLSHSDLFSNIQIDD